jgi:hypothetical protein
MPVLTANQIVPQAKQTATLSVRVSATAEQVAAPAGQTVEVIDASGPPCVVTANQTMEPGTQRVRLIVTPWKGPAEPRAERQPAEPRP